MRVSSAMLPFHLLLAKLGHRVLADSEQALGPKRKRWRADSPLLQGNGRRILVGAPAELPPGGCFRSGATQSGETVALMWNRNSGEARASSRSTSAVLTERASWGALTGASWH